MLKRYLRFYFDYAFAIRFHCVVFRDDWYYGEVCKYDVYLNLNLKLQFRFWLLINSNIWLIFVSIVQLINK